MVSARAEAEASEPVAASDRLVPIYPVLRHYSDMETEPVTPPERKRRSGLHIFMIVLVTVLVTAAATLWIAKAYIFPTEFKPVTLSAREEQALETKLQRLDSLEIDSRSRGRNRAQSRTHSPDSPIDPAPPAEEALEPEPYSEAGAERTISLSERELNALLAKNTDLARKLAIDLSEDLVSAKLLVPVDPDFPILGGKILKVRAGLELAYREQRPIVILKGITIMGVPLPNAWMGGIKNIDLVEQYGTEEGFWKAFSDGVENISISEGKLNIELKE